MELLNELIGFYKLPFEKFLTGVTHEGWIEMSIDDVVALAEVGMKHGLDWKSLVLVLIDLELEDPLDVIVDDGGWAQERKMMEEAA